MSAKQQDTTTRRAYVQRYVIGGGIGLDDLRELVAVTADFDKGSHVALEGHKVTVTETKASQWFTKKATA